MGATSGSVRCGDGLIDRRLLRAAAGVSAVLSNKNKTRRLPSNRPCSGHLLKSPNPQDVYAPAGGLWMDSTTMQSNKLSNSDFWRCFSM